MFWVNMLSILLFLFCITGVLLVTLWHYFKFKQNYWRNLNIKYFQPVPLFGNVTRSMLLLNSFQEIYQEMYEAMGNNPYAGYYDMNIPTLLVKDPHLISTILVKDFKHFTNRGRSAIFMRNKKLNKLSLHVGSEHNERWKFLRQVISPFFTTGKMKQMYEKLADATDKVDCYLDQQMNGQNSADVELKYFSERLSSYFIISCIFGTKGTFFTSIDEFQYMMKETIQPKLIKTWHTLLAAYCPSWLNDVINRAEISDKVLDYFGSLVLNSVEYRRLHGVEGNDILQSLMNLQNSHVNAKFAVCDDNEQLEPLKKFDEIDILANAYILLFGGFDTTSTIMGFCVYELALNEHIQQNLRVEVQNVKDECGCITYDSLKKMSFLDAVIAETLRKYPSTLTLSRVCSEDYVISGSQICLPKGIHIKIPIWSIQHDRRHYPNPEKFDPQRFLGNNKYSGKNGTYLSFGDGPRSCVAKRFGEVILKAAVADLILKYDMKPCAKTEIPVKFGKGSAVLMPANGIWVNISKRKT